MLRPFTRPKRDTSSTRWRALCFSRPDCRDTASREFHTEPRSEWLPRPLEFRHAAVSRPSRLHLPIRSSLARTPHRHTKLIERAQREPERPQRTSTRHFLSAGQAQLSAGTPQSRCEGQAIWEALRPTGRDPSSISGARAKSRVHCRGDEHQVTVIFAPRKARVPSVFSPRPGDPIEV